jgi:fructose-1-phosphate kinase PfkB-like protein
VGQGLPLAGVGQGLPLPEAARLGVACAAANCLTPTSGVVDPATIPALLQQTSITPKKLTS